MKQTASELVRITVNVDAAAVAVPEIRARLDAEGCDVPWSATSTTTATSCSSVTGTARGRWRS